MAVVWKREELIAEKFAEESDPFWSVPRQLGVSVWSDTWAGHQLYGRLLLKTVIEATKSTEPYSRNVLYAETDPLIFRRSASKPCCDTRAGVGAGAAPKASAM